MDNQPSHNSGPAGAATAPVSDSSSPSAEMLQHAVDQAALFNLLTCPQADRSSPLLRSSQGVVGIRICEKLHRFRVTTQGADAAPPLGAANVVGECIGRSQQRWMIIPDGFVAQPDADPPPTALDPTRSQRFVMLDAVYRFGDGSDGFRGFGTGYTLPATGNGRLQALAVGTVLGGFGKFEGHGEGTYLYCGTLDPQCGFKGSLFIRVMDPEQTVRTEQPLPKLASRSAPEQGVTYVVFRGEAVPSDAVRPNLGPDGKQIGLIVEQGLLLHHIDAASQGPEGIRTADCVGRRIGRITAYVAFDPSSASGTALDPVPFTSYDELVFCGRDGRRIGGITAESREGRVFNVQVLGQSAIRFGGTGRIRAGTGPFEGINGLMTDNSLVVFTPHVSASVYVLRLCDPTGRFRVAIGS